MTKRPLRISRLMSALLSIAFVPFAHAFEPFVVKDIRVEGIQRIEAGTVFSYLPVKVGQQFTDDQATEAIRSLFGTGFFRDVRIETQNGVVVVSVEERPAIASVEFNGMKEFDATAVTTSLREVGLGEGRIYDRSVLEKAVQELKRQYLSRGKYSVEVVPTVTPLDRNRVAVSFDIFEGDIATIKEIKIIGAKHFSESDLLDLLQQTTSGVMTWYTKTNQYSRQKLQGDIETIRSFYMNQGFLEFSMEPPQITISPDRQNIYVTLTITEGDRYKIGNIKLAGELLGLDQDINALIDLKQGDVFSAEQVNTNSQTITEFFGDLGYAFANVNASPNLDKTNHIADLTFFIDPNKRVYVRRVNIGGNTRTRDVVVRREMRQLESAWYNSKSIKTSKQRLDRLGYFQEVFVDTPSVPGTQDQVDVNVSVSEKPTGMISLGIGYSTTDKIVLSAGISQDNIFGSGTNASLDVNTSKTNRTLAISQTDPFATESGISRNISMYYRTIEPVESNSGYYRLRTFGGGLTYGVPVTETDRIFPGLSIESNKIDIDETSPSIYQRYVHDYGNSSYAVIPSIAWTRDRRDSAMTPNEGGMTRLAAEASVAGDLKYYKFTAQQQYYWPLTKRMTLAMNAQVDYGAGYSNRPYPVIKNLYAGGIGTVRGFEGSTLGPRDPKTGDALGGSKRFVANAELYLPFPGTQQDRSLRWFVFTDAGNVFGDDDKMDFSELRYSAGIGLSWQSPIGPLKLSLARPLNAKEGDRKQQFQFQIGTGF